MPVDVQALAKLPLLQRLSLAELGQIAPLARMQDYGAGQTVVHQGEACQAVYFVSRGTLRTRRVSPEGREQILSYLGPGSMVGLVPALDGGPCGATVDAVLSSTLLTLSAHNFRTLLAQYHPLALAVAEHLASEVRRLSGMVEDLALRTVRARLARFLLTRVDNPAGPRRWTQEDIASYIGTVREMVARTLRAMTDEGLLRREHGRIVITDRTGLEREAGGEA